MAVPFVDSVSESVPSKRSHVLVPAGGGRQTPVPTTYSTSGAMPMLPAASAAIAEKTCVPEPVVSIGVPVGLPRPQSTTPDSASLQVKADGTTLPGSTSCRAYGVAMAIDGGVASRLTVIEAVVVPPSLVALQV